MFIWENETLGSFGVMNVERTLSGFYFWYLPQLFLAGFGDFLSKMSLDWVSIGKFLQSQSCLSLNHPRYDSIFVEVCLLISKYLACN